MSDPMTPDQLAAYLQEMEREAVSYRSSELEDDQATAISYYEARPFGDEVDGQSQFVMPVVQETVDYMTISVLRTFISGDRVVEFSPKDAEGEQSAEEATEHVNHVFLREQDGYKVLHDWLQTGLIEKCCAVKTACVEDVKRKRHRITVDELQLAAMMEGGETITEAEEVEPGIYNITVEERRVRKKYIDLPIPNYEFLFASHTRHEDEATYLCHRVRKTKSDLVEMGFDRALVESLPRNDEGQAMLDSRETETWEDEDWAQSNDDIPGLAKVLLREEYARIDYNNDGIAELLKVFRVGKTILEAEEVDEQPFVVFSPFPRSHRMVGNGLADKTMDLQRSQSVVMRQTFNGFNLTNAPRMWLDQGSVTETTIDDLLTVAPGVIVRGKGAPPTPLSVPYDVSRSVSLIEFLKGEQETRTGITRLNQGLDADTINDTASGQAKLSALGQQMEEFVARNFAECLARLFQKKMRLMIAHGDPVTMRIGGEYRTADPSQWTDDLDVEIRVGLGSGSKDQRMAYRQQLAQMQMQAFPIGLANKKNLYNMAAGFVRDAQLGDPNDYFIDPDSPEAMQEQEGPPPEVQAAQIKAQSDVQTEQIKAQAKVQTEREKTAANIALKREQGAAEMELRREEMMLEAATKENISNTQPGGSLAS